MAKKIDVFRGSRRISSLKKSIVLLSIRRLTMEWVVENESARYVQVKPASVIPSCRIVPPVPQVYIPERLEPVIDRRIGVVAQSPSQNIARHMGFSLVGKKCSRDLAAEVNPFAMDMVEAMGL